MQMVAASKMRKAQQAAIGPRPFVLLLYRIQRLITTRPIAFTHPLLAVREVRKRAVIIVAADKGLCGALNTNVFRLAAQFDPERTIFIAAGRKAAQFIARSGRQLAAEFAYGDSPTFDEARVIARFARDQFLSGEVDETRIVGTRFINTLSQQALSLPFPLERSRDGRCRGWTTSRPKGKTTVRPSSSRACTRSSNTCLGTT
jgi:F-type H+-transporting ATPase subunit gamma